MPLYFFHAAFQYFFPLYPLFQPGHCAVLSLKPLSDNTGQSEVQNRHWVVNYPLLYQYSCDKGACPNGVTARQWLLCSVCKCWSSCIFWFRFWYVHTDFTAALVCLVCVSQVCRDCLVTWMAASHHAVVKQKEIKGRRKSSLTH